MKKQYKLSGTITLPIEMIVECDTDNPSEFAENAILEQGYVFFNAVDYNQDVQIRKMKVSPIVTERGAIESHEVKEVEPVTSSTLVTPKVIVRKEGQERYSCIEWTCPNCEVENSEALAEKTVKCGVCLNTFPAVITPELERYNNVEPVTNSIFCRD